MLQELPIVFSQVKADNNISENLLNEIRHIVFSLYGAGILIKYFTIM